MSNKLVVEVINGVVVSVWSTNPDLDIQVVVRDRDNIEIGEEDPVTPEELENTFFYY
jgi:hypothetical protein